MPTPKPRKRKRPTAIDAGRYREKVLAARDALVEAHVHLVRPIASNIRETAPPSFELDDLIAWGYHGLIRAATRYKPFKRGAAPFPQFARPRIRGAILDSMRRGRWEEATRTDQLETAAGFCPHSDGGSEAEVIEQNIDRMRMRRSLWTAIEALPPDQREIIEGFCRDETSSTIGAALGLADWRVEREHAGAIAELKRRLGG